MAPSIDAGVFLSSRVARPSMDGAISYKVYQSWQRVCCMLVALLLV
jgi:hypothetical protein